MESIVRGLLGFGDNLIKELQTKKPWEGDKV